MPSRIRSLERIRVTSSPPSLMLPRRASIRPTRDLRKVVLPAPLAPSSSTVSPARTPTASSKGAASGGMLPSEKHFDDLRHLHRDRELAFENLLAGVHDDDAIGNVFNETHQMLDDDDRHPDRKSTR